MSEFILSNEKISEISEKCTDFYRNVIPKKRQLPLGRVTLSIEELLIQLQSSYGKNASCILTFKESIFGSKILFTVPGVRINPFSIENDDLIYSRQILTSFAGAPDYRYNSDRGTNEITFELIKKPIKNKMLISIFAALILAIVFRMLLGLLPAETMEFLKDGIVAPIFSKITAVITGVATFLVFFSVITGITGVGSSATLGAMSSKLIKSCGISYLFAGIVMSAISCLLYPITSTPSSGSNVVKDLLQLVLDMIPSNLLDCFVQDNDLQVIILAIFIGSVLLLMGDKARSLNEIIITLSDVINKMMAIICKTLPAVVFFGILNMLMGDISGIIRVYKVAIIYVISSVLIISFLFLKLRLVTKTSPAKLFKDQWSTTLINLTTSSQVAALPESFKCCKEKWKIDPHFVDFSLPLCVVTYMPCGASFLGAVVYGMADLSGVPIDVSFIIKLGIMAIIVAIAAPPIPGSAFAVMPIMMAGCGVPDTYYSVAIVLGTILGYFLPALNGFCMQLEVLYTAHRLDIVNKSH